MARKFRAIWFSSFAANIITASFGYFYCDYVGYKRMDHCLIFADRNMMK